MTTCPYRDFIVWSLKHQVPSLRRNGVMSQAREGWIFWMGVVAGRIDRYFALGHPTARVMPNSLVLDVLELEQSPYADFPVEDPRRALIDTWSGLAGVYGTRLSEGMELVRLNLLVDWAEAVTTPVSAEFPGKDRMKSGFQNELLRLDPRWLARQRRNSGEVASLAELLELYPCANS